MLFTNGRDEQGGRSLASCMRVCYEGGTIKGGSSD